MAVAKSFWDKFGSESNAQKWFDIEIWQQIKAVFSPCCGLGRKTVRFKDGHDKQISLKFPINYLGNDYSQVEFEQEVASNYGKGFVCIMLNPYKMLVICNKEHKDNEFGGLPNIDDYITV